MLILLPNKHKWPIKIGAYDGHVIHSWNL